MKKLFSQIGRLSTILIFLVGFLSSCQRSQPSNADNDFRARKTNIVYILADDLGYGDLSIYGQSKFETPNIDQLAKDGMLFTQHYAGSTVCAPSRSSLITGLHTGHTFIRGNKEVMPEGQYPLDSSVITIAKLLQGAGYVTGAFGKWGLGYPGSIGDPNYQGFEEFYGYNCQRMGHNYYPYHLWGNQTQLTLDENSGTQSGIYGPDIIHRKALDFIEENKDTTFFMYYPSIIPHAELLVPEEYLARFRGKYPPEENFEGIDEGEEEYRIGGYGSQKEPHAAFAAMVYLLDVQVGEIRAKLEELEIADNTLIIFTSDNGPHKEGGADPDYFASNNGMRGYKRDLYEGGIRVPFIAYWPDKIAPGVISDHMSAFWDFMPTACDIAGIEVPDDIDGISYLPTLLQEEQQAHEYLYWEFHEGGGKQAVRLGDWKAVRLDVHENSEAPIELYNLEIDRGEQDNVAMNNPKIVEKVKSIMEKEHVPSEVFAFKYEEGR
ncbi:MAG: arylsulfatase [Cyclobacteriaceae bacterium]